MKDQWIEKVVSELNISQSDLVGRVEIGDLKKYSKRAPHRHCRKGSLSGLGEDVGHKSEVYRYKSNQSIRVAA